MPIDDGQLLFANMTLYAPDGLPIVLMERFESLTSTVDCKGDDGAMSLTFKSKQAYNYALKTWQYINEANDKQFLLIANHDGCGPADERQPYKVSSVTEDSAELTIAMKSTVAAWSEVAGSYDLDFGKAALRQTSQRMRPRGFWGDIANVGKDVLEAAQGNADVSKSVSFNVAAGESGKKETILKDPKGRLSIDCIDCYVTGSWQVQGHIVVNDFKLQDLTLQAAPQSFKAVMQLQAVVTATASPAPLQESKELFAAGIPGAGIAVPGIFKLGVSVSYEVGTSATFAGSATVDFGLEASLPNNAKVIADITNPSSSSATGWQGTSFKPNLEVTKLSASLTLAAFSKPKLSFGIELVKVGQVDVGLTMKLPEISSALSAEYDANGLCSQSSGASKTGVKIENKAVESLDLEINVDLGADNPKPSWSKSLLEFTQPLGNECFPLQIPGLGPSDGTPTSSASGGGTTSAPPTTCSPPGKKGVCQSTSKTCAGGAYIPGYCDGDESIRCCPNAEPTEPTTPKPTTCKPPGKTGICQSTTLSCAGGTYITGYCPGNNDIKCCPDAAPATKPTTCKPPGKTGICQRTTLSCAGGTYISGFCPGDENIKCCPDAAPVTTCAPPGKTGICQKTNITCKGGAYVSGLCPGGSDTRCCPDVTPSAGGGGGGCKMKRDRFGKRVLVC
ncbi:MAG: hypothetical protein LQ348_001939 [Seirophora lacunosa]|nr:MAG: hypothetical protein LQ348_001939 [Seirophora lacunosa]